MKFPQWRKLQKPAPTTTTPASTPIITSPYLSVSLEHIPPATDAPSLLSRSSTVGSESHIQRFRSLLRKKGPEKTKEKGKEEVVETETESPAEKPLPEPNETEKAAPPPESPPDIQTLTHRRSTLETTIKTLQTQTATLETHLTTTLQTLRTLHDTLLKTLETNTTLTHTLQSQNEQTTTLKTQLETLLSEREELLAEYNALYKKCEKLEEDVHLSEKERKKYRKQREVIRHWVNQLTILRVDVVKLMRGYDHGDVHMEEKRRDVMNRIEDLCQNGWEMKLMEGDILKRRGTWAEGIEGDVDKGRGAWA